MRLGGTTRALVGTVSLLRHTVHVNAYACSDLCAIVPDTSTFHSYCLLSTFYTTTQRYLSTMAEATRSATKKAKTAEKYHLSYWPGIPGRGEFVRLALEEAGAEYEDTPGGADEVLKHIDPKFHDEKNPPPLAPPMLRVGETLIYNTANILLFLGPRLGLVPDDEIGPYHVNEISLAALDLNNEAHNSHHPIGSGLYYEDQKPEALRAAENFRKVRIPKFFGYFNRVLAQNKQSKSEWLVGKGLTYADLVVFHVVDGVKFAFPKASAKVLKENKLLQEHYDRVKAQPRIKAYLESDRRQKFSMGIFRYYPELDGED